MCVPSVYGAYFVMEQGLDVIGQVVLIRESLSKRVAVAKVGKEFGYVKVRTSRKPVTQSFQVYILESEKAKDNVILGNEKENVASL